MTNPVATLRLEGFADLEPDLLALALLPPGQPVPAALQQRLAYKYGLGVAQGPDVLTFYGNAFIGAILANEFRTSYLLGLTPDTLDRASRSIARTAQANLYLDTASETCARFNAASQTVQASVPGNSAYAQVSTPVMVTPGARTPGNCNYTLSAVVGALFFQYGMTRAIQITDWFRSMVPINEIISRHQATVPGAFPPAHSPVVTPVPAAVAVPAVAAAAVGTAVLSAPTTAVLAAPVVPALPTCVPPKGTLELHPVEMGDDGTLTDFGRAISAQTNGMYKVLVAPVPGKDLLGINLVNTTNNVVSPIASVPDPGLAAAAAVDANITPKLLASTANLKLIEGALRGLGLWV